MVPHCFHDPEVVELVARQWRSPAPPLAVHDRYGNTIHLIREPTRTYAYYGSPFESGVSLAATGPTEVRSDNLLEGLVDQLLQLARPHPNLLLRVRVPGYFFETHPHALLEPFLLHGFTVQMHIWERLVDLRATPEEILARCVTMVRRKISRGLREQVKWHVHYGEPVPESRMRELYEAARHTREAAGSRLKHAPELYLRDRRALIENGKAALGIVEHGSFTGYLLALVSEDLAFYFDGAWSGARSEFANHLLHYKMMLFLRELGCRRYSAGYVLPDLLSRQEAVTGMARFKHGLGTDLSPVYTLTLMRESRLGAVVSRLRRTPLGPALAHVRRLVERS